MSAHELSAQGATEGASPSPQARPRRRSGVLTLSGLSPDGKRLLLVDVAGEEFSVEVDAHLRAIIDPEPARGPERGPERRLETSMDSVLRPRDIQARIRAGETPENVASAAQTTVEKVMPYAAPVLAEREHVAQRAQRSSLRRSGGEAGSARTLGDAIGGWLRSLNVDPDSVSWDAWRREDGRWSLSGRFSVSGREGAASFTFDQPGNFVVLDNDDARWLVGDLPDAPTRSEESAPPVAGARRLAAVHDPAPSDEQLPLGDELGDDALQLVQADQPLEAFLDDEPGADESELVEEATDAAAPDRDPEPTSEPEPPRRPVKKTRGRASVPSWDEIMFGGPSDSDRA